MKKSIFYFLFFIFYITSCYSQGTLQFNRVLTVSTATTTVPTGKVWKVTNYFQSGVSFITSSAYSETTCTNPGSKVHPLVINGKNYFINNNGAIGWGSSGAVYLISPYNMLPLWLPVNSTLATICSDDFASVIEFNIIP